MRSRNHYLHLLSIVFVLLIPACSYAKPVDLSATSAATDGSAAGEPADPTITPFQPKTSPAAPTAEPTAAQAPRTSLWIDPSLPTGWIEAPEAIEIAPSAEEAVFQIRVEPSQGSGSPALVTTDWIYALVTPFPTILDGVTQDELVQAWQGGEAAAFAGSPILMDAPTLAMMTAVFGAPAENAVRVVDAGQLVDEAWSAQPAWAIVPFEAIEPRWKVLAVDGQSPITKEFDPQAYALQAQIGLFGPQDQLESFSALWNAGEGAFTLPASNRDPSKMTTLIMTGVTALVRATAHKMDTLGVNYPGQDIRDILRAADITHISNEVSFASDCPPGDPATNSLRFCSKSEYIGLLEDVGADVIELTGNHMNDWGTEAMAYSLDLYKQHGFQVFAGGMNLEEARAALTIENNGNRLAFIGCNPPGPEYVWATETEPGAATCDYDWMHAEVKRLTDEGYLVISTFQYAEAYDPVPMPWQQKDFKGMAEAGAVIVSGSQAHYPQAMEFVPGSFIHYGLGNLFFDQQNFIDGNTGQLVVGTRWEFADRHVFYDGRYISTELLTFMLEDWAKPRLMTPEERSALLDYIFTASGW